MVKLQKQTGRLTGGRSHPCFWEGGSSVELNPAMFGIFTPFHLP